MKKQPKSFKPKHKNMPFKENPEGQTHYYGDGCPEHSNQDSNFLQVGQTIEYGACFPDKYPDCKEIDEKYGKTCECKCHKTIEYFEELAHAYNESVSEKDRDGFWEGIAFAKDFFKHAVAASTALKAKNKHPDS